MKRYIYASKISAAKGRSPSKSYESIKFGGWSKTKPVILEQIDVVRTSPNPNTRRKSKEELLRYVRSTISEAENVRNKMEEYMNILIKYNKSAQTPADIDQLEQDLEKFKFSQN